MKKQEIMDKYAIGYIYKQVEEKGYTNVGVYDFTKTFRQNVVNAVGRARYDRGDGYYVYFEPFVGGANMIDKIKCKRRIGCDIQKELIELLKYTQTNLNNIPDRILEDEYIKVKNNKSDYPSWYVGLVGFCASFGAKYFGGYARDSRDDNSGKWSAGAIKNLKKQAPNIQDVKFINDDYLTLNETKLHNCVIYCDPPYEGTLKYSTGGFEYDVFWQWVRDVSKNNYVFISEYNAPEDFRDIWSKECKTLLDSNKNTNDIANTRVEKLFIHNNGLYHKTYL